MSKQRKRLAYGFYLTSKDYYQVRRKMLWKTREKKCVHVAWCGNY